MDAPWIFFILLFITLLIGGGLLLAFLIVKLVRRLFGGKGGWQELAGAFPVPAGELAGEKFTRQTIAVGPVIYKNCVTVVVSPLRLHLSTRIKRLGIFLPWDRIRKSGERTFYWQRHPVLSIGDPEQGTIAVSENLFARLSAYLRKKN